MKIFGAIKVLVTGVAVGAAISIAPFPLYRLCATVFFGFWVALVMRRSPAERVSLFVVARVAFATVLGAIWLPVKQLDGTVGPFSYEPMSIEDLCQKLASDHRVFVTADCRTGTNMMATFGSNQSMSRREVLEKLARETGCDLKNPLLRDGSYLAFWCSPEFHEIAS